jgi:glycosyltransferase involved in cell wall biosynthesis
MGGIEWERPKFGFFAKLYLKFCFWLGTLYSKWVILDNEYYKCFVSSEYLGKSVVIPYGGEIDDSLELSEILINKFEFLTQKYFLSISRSLEDNQLDELCNSFVGINEKLVLISNFSKSNYGLKVMNKFINEPNIYLIDGLYNKSELDLVRRKCHAYIHTHTLCGTAPSLVEMIVCRKPIISFDIPQNRFSLDGQGTFFNNFTDLKKIVTTVIDFQVFIPNEKLCQRYNWKDIVDQYEKTYY